MEKSHDLVMYMYDDLKLDIKGWPIRRPLKTSLKSFFFFVCVCGKFDKNWKHSLFSAFSQKIAYQILETNIVCF